MASKIFQAVLCPTQLFQFALSTNTALATKFQIDYNSTLHCFSDNSLKPCCIDTLFPTRDIRSEDVQVHKYRYIYRIWAIIEGILVIVYQINATLRHKTT